MRAVLQRVDFAKVTVSKREISAIGPGLLVFIGVEKGDEPSDADALLDKIIHLRVFEDENNRMNRSLLDIGGELLAISQFTLLGDCRRGRRPSFTEAEEPQKARALYDYFAERAAGQVRVGKGEFQAMMKIESVNNGPVTIILDSRKRF